MFYLYASNFTQDFYTTEKNFNTNMSAISKRLFPYCGAWTIESGRYYWSEHLLGIL